MVAASVDSPSIQITIFSLLFSKCTEGKKPKVRHVRCLLLMQKKEALRQDMRNQEGNKTSKAKETFFFYRFSLTRVKETNLESPSGWGGRSS